MDYSEKSLKAHRKWAGKIEICAKPALNSKEDLAVAYTPGVAAACLEIEKNPSESYDYTLRHNLCAVITDGSAVLGLGDIGPAASMPVMEGKCALFKAFGGVDAFPLCVDTKDVDEFVNTVAKLQYSFGGINLEDISAPRCFEIEEKLKKACSIPVFHDDQHGTAIIVLAGLINALRLTGKDKETVKVVTCGAGAAGCSIVKLMLDYGFKNIIMCDRPGALYEGMEGINSAQAELAKRTNREKKQGSLAEMLKGADIFIGTSAGGIVTKEMVQSMNSDAVVFACANPVPEIFPEDAKAAGAKVVASGRSDFPNQINNVLAFPGIFRGAFDAKATEINEEMKMAAAKALSSLVSGDELCEDYIIPDAFDSRVAKAVAGAVADVAVKCGCVRGK